MAEENKSNSEIMPIEEMPQRSDMYVASAEAMGLAFMNPVRWKAMEVMARTFVQSGALPASLTNAARLIMVFQAGYEAGLQPIESINAFYFVNGKLTMYGDQVIAQVLKAGHKIEWGKCDHTVASVKITRADGNGSYEDAFTWKEAEDRGLVNAIYKKYPNHMLKYKVFSMVAKFIVPDAIKGVQIGETEEMVQQQIVAGIINEKATHGSKSNAEPAETANTTDVSQAGDAPSVEPHSSLTEALDKPAEVPTVDEKPKSKEKGKAKTNGK